MTEATSQQIDFLRAQLTSQIVSAEQRSNRQRIRTILFRIVILLLSIGVTLALGLKGNSVFRGLDDALSALSLTMSAVVSLFTALEAFLDPRGMWIAFNKTLWALYRVKDDLEYKSIGPKPIPLDELDALYQRLQDLLVDANAGWAQRRERTIETGRPGQ
jgi:hypothetical protein